ncbi:reverse transcriptase domain-containing protein [Tanacetum coccineum]
MADDQPMCGNNRAVAPTLGAAIVAVDLGDKFTVKDHHLSMIKDRQFHNRFTQHPNESLVDALLRIEELLRSCHGHGLGQGTIIQIFYHGLDEATQAILDAGGIFLYKTPNEAHRLLEDRVLLKLDWSKDIKAKPLRKTISFAEVVEDHTHHQSVMTNPWEDLRMKKKTMHTEDIEEEDIEETTTIGVLATSNHQAAIQDLETKFGRLSDQCSSRPTGTLPSNTQTNPKPNPTNDKPYRPPPARNEHVNVVFTRSCKTYDPPANLNAKTTVIYDDSEDAADKAEKEVESSSSKQAKSDPPPLKAYKPKILYPQRLRKEKMEERYAKFIDLIKEVRINVPLVDVLAGMPNYGKFLKDLVSNKSKMEQISTAFLNEECSAIVQNKLPPKLGDPRSFLILYTLAGSVEYLALADLGASINLMPYSLYASLCENNLKPTRMNFVILQMEEDDKVPLILGRPFLHTVDAIIQVKNKDMQHSHSSDDTCFRMDVINQVTDEELDVFLDDSEPFSNTSEKINESSLDKEFKEFMAANVEGIPKQKEEDEDNFEELPIEENLRIKTSIQDPPTDLEMKPLPKHLEYAFLEKRFSSLTVLGQSEGKHFRPIHFSSKTLKKAQQNYTVTEKEQLAGAENVAADHLSRLENTHLEELRDEDIDDNFPNETLMNVSSNDEGGLPWFADFANYLVGKILRKGLTYTQRCKFFSKLKHYFWDDPYLFKMCPDGMIRRCVYGSETQKILDECHHGPTGGQYGPSTTTKKVFDAGFYWPTIFKEALTLVQNCDACQCSGSLSHRDEMPQNSIQVSEIFDIWGMDFIGPFPKSYTFEYILVAIDYMSKWAEAEALPTNDARVVINFLKKLFSRFGIPKALISDRGTHFCNKQMEKVLKQYGVHHRFAIAYHLQISEQVKNTNRALKRILKKTVKDNPSVWSRKLDDAFSERHTKHQLALNRTGCCTEKHVTCRLKLNIMLIGPLGVVIPISTLPEKNDSCNCMNSMN